MPKSKEEVIDDFIHTALGYLFDDLPSEEKELKSVIETLRDAFQGKLLKENNYYLVQDCLLYPERYLFSLEKLIPDLTLLDVQTGLYRYITTRLKVIAQKINLDLEKLAWSKELLAIFEKHPLAKKAFNKKEKSAQNAEGAESKEQEEKEGEEKEEVINDHIIDTEDTLYRCELIFNHDFNIITLHIKTKLPLPRETIIIEPFAEPPEEKDFDEEAFWEKTEASAELFAEQETAQYALQTLPEGVKNKIVSLSLGQRKLLSHLSYYQLFKNDDISLELFEDFTREQAIALLNPAIILLHKKGKINLIEVPSYATSEYRIITHFFYCKLIAEGRLSIGNDIVGISKEKSALFMRPAIIQLIEKGVLSFSQAKDIPPAIADVINNEYYFRGLLEKKYSLNHFKNVTPHNKEIIKSSGVIALLIHEFISFEKALTLSPRTAKLLEKPPIQTLVLENSIPLESLDHLSPHAVFLIEQDPLIYLLVSKNILKPEEVDVISPFPAEAMPVAIKENNFSHPLLKAIIPIFLQYASLKLLFLKDLYYLYNNIDPFLNNAAAKENRNPEILLKNHFFHLNLEERLKGLLVNKPCFLSRNKKDSFSELRKACAHVNISFQSICNAVLKTAAKEHSPKNPSPMLTAFIAHSNELGFTPRVIWGTVYGLQLHTLLLMNQPTQKDIRSLLTSIKKTSKKQNVMERKLRGETIKFALLFLLEHIKNECRVLKRTLPNWLGPICALISETEESTKTKGNLPASLKWQYTLQAIIERATQSNVVNQVALKKSDEEKAAPVLFAATFDTLLNKLPLLTALIKDIPTHNAAPAPAVIL